MSCRERAGLLGAYVDGELDLSASLELEAHLATCAACTARVAELRQLSRTIHLGATKHAAIRELVDTLRASIRPTARGRSSSDHTSSRKPPLWRPSLALFASAAAAVILAWMGGVWWARPSAESRLGEDVVGAHIRSLQAEHLTDVASSDRHTVNPWFQGKLTFAVKAEDHADRGFPLIGGRLDFVGGSNVAALVYRHGKHVLNVFEWPIDASSSSEPKLVTLRGYAAEHWIASGLNVWVVSDADPSTLAELTALLRRE